MNTLLHKHEVPVVRNIKRRVFRKAEVGTSCPCCGSLVKVYKYPLHQSLAEAMIKLVRVHERTGDWVHVKFVDPTRHLAKAKHWGLVEPKPKDSGDSLGYWRPTKAGNDFVYKHSRISSHAFIRQNRVVSLSPEFTTILDILGEGKYSDLMAAL